MSSSAAPDQPEARARHVEPVPLDAVLVTHRLAERPPRAPDHAAENRALMAVARAMGHSTRATLDALMREALVLCRPDGNATAGVSLLEQDATTGKQCFRWTAMAGRLAHHVGGATPRDFSPCGTCLDRMAPVLFERPDTCFTYFLETGVPFVEGLVIPFRVHGEPAGTIWIVSHDDTRRFDAEDARLMTDLAEFTGTAYTLLAAREAADGAREERERTLQTLSHEWRTPLAAIAGLTRVVEDGMAGAVNVEQQSLLRRARMAADHLLTLANRTLVRARPQGTPDSVAAIDDAPARLDLREMVAETAAMVEPAARSAGLAFAVRLDPAPAWVKADGTRVRQVLLNLLDNAVKYTREGGVTVTLERAGDGRARVIIRDTGVGMTDGELEHAFDRFWRAEGVADPAATDRAHRGEGLGLAISRDMARAMGGDLAAESVPGAGSTFLLSLPPG